MTKVLRTRQEWKEIIEDLQRFQKQVSNKEILGES